VVSHTFRLARLLISCFYLSAFAAIAAAGQAPASPAAQALTSGDAIYQAGCAGCHGPHGEGAPETSTMFQRPSTFPDFTDCSGTTPELDVDWKATPMRRRSPPSQAPIAALSSYRLLRLRPPDWRSPERGRGASENK
jgi:mono/diheme cytochrome c family protein